MVVAELHLPAHVFERFNIGYWAWELPEMHDEHLAGFRRINEVWVPSAFVQDAVSKKSPVPVLRMPHADPLQRVGRWRTAAIRPAP